MIMTKDEPALASLLKTKYENRSGAAAIRSERSERFVFSLS